MFTQLYTHFAYKLIYTNYITMKKFFYLLLPLTVFTAFISSCSSDDTFYDPYITQEKNPFYPQEIVINKESKSRKVSEKWTFEYGTDKKITAYTHETTTKHEYREKENSYTETTIETEKGELSYYSDEEIQTKITVEKEIFGLDYEKFQKEEITEIAKCANNHITEIKRYIDSSDKNGKVTGSTITKRTFSYSGDYCTQSIFTDNEKAAEANNTTYTYNWNGAFELANVDIDEKGGSSRTRKTYKYRYGNIGANHIFQTNAFLYNHLPQIYAAMGYFGKDCPYTIYREEQDFSLFIDGKWEKDNSSDSKLFNLLNPDNDEFKYDISSDIYSAVYNIKFIK